MRGGKREGRTLVHTEGKRRREGGPYSYEYVLGIYAPMIYTAPCVMLLMGAASVMRASRRGLGPGNRDFFGLYEMSSSR